jgi:hypothetical protein
MKYLCLICAEKVMEQMTEAAAELHFQEYTEFTDAIRASGHYLGCNRLLPPNEAITVRVRNGNVTTTDRPYVETKEHGTYYLIEARDLNVAIQVAARIPGAWLGCVEVRPIAEDEQTLKALGFVDRETFLWPKSRIGNAQIGADEKNFNRSVDLGIRHSANVEGKIYLTIKS